MGHGDSPWPGAFFNQSRTKPAFFRIQDDGWFLFLGVWHHNIGWTHLDAKVAAITYIGIEFLPFIGSWWIWCHIYFVAHFRSPFLITLHNGNVTLELESPSYNPPIPPLN